MQQKKITVQSKVALHFNQPRSRGALNMGTRNELDRLMAARDIALFCDPVMERNNYQIRRNPDDNTLAIFETFEDVPMLHTAFVGNRPTWKHFFSEFRYMSGE